MTLTPKQLLKQLKDEVEWFRLQIQYIPGCGGTNCVHDHADTALDIIEEITRSWELLDETYDNLRRLHDLIKGAASHEAMELIRRMMG